MNLKNNIKIINNSVVLNIKVIPNSSKNELFSIMSNGIFKIRLNAIPENGKANKALIDFLSSELLIKKSQINIISGLTDKNKIVKIDF